MASPSSPDSLQLLTSLLSDQNPYSLPYSNDAKPLIHQHLFNLTLNVPSLRVLHDTFVQNDGSSAKTLQVVGTFPMAYNGFTYNIPVTIWLLEDYPVAAPRVFVTPARNMVFKRHHKHVDASGLVSVPYLDCWVYPISNLLGLVRSLGVIFGRDPPLYSYSSARSRKEQSGGSPAAQLYSAASQSLPTSPTPSPPVATSPSQSKRGTENPVEVFKRNVTNTLEERLRKDLLQVRKTQEAEMDNLMNIQAQLRQREHQLERGLQAIGRERDGLEWQCERMRIYTEVIDSWIKSNVNYDPEFGIDDVYEPSDVLSKQLLDCTSADQAIEDILYSLEKAVQEGLIPMDKYFKSVRSLAREQFFHRAISVKIRAAQRYIC